MTHSKIALSKSEIFYKQVFRLLSFASYPLFIVAFILDYLKFGSIEGLVAGFVEKEAKWMIFAICYFIGTNLSYFVQSARVEFAKDFERADGREE